MFTWWEEDVAPFNGELWKRYRLVGFRKKNVRLLLFGFEHSITRKDKRETLLVIGLIKCGRFVASFFKYEKDDEGMIRRPDFLYLLGIWRYVHHKLFMGYYILKTKYLRRRRKSLEAWIAEHKSTQS